MTSIVTSQRERFLDHFPVSDNELDRLLSLYPYFEVSLAAAAHKDSSSARRHDGSCCCGALSASCLAAEKQQQQTNEQKVSHCELCCILPELVTILREAVASVFLVGSFCNEPEAIQQQATFLEAVVSLLGRRGDRFVRSVLFSTAAAAKSRTTMEDAASSCTSGGPPRATTLMNLVYRLVLARFFLENNSIMKNQQQPDGKSNSVAQQHLLLDDVLAEASAHAAPMSWLRSISTGNHDNTTKLATVVSSSVSDGLPDIAAESNDSNKTITFAMWNQWTTETAPNIHQALTAVFHFVLLGGALIPPGQQRPTSSSTSSDECEGIVGTESSFFFPIEEQQQQQQRQGEEAGVFTIIPEPLPLPLFDHAPRVFSSAASDDDLHHLVSYAAPLAAMTLGGNWRRIYASSVNGLSFRTFQQALLGYAGPTVLLIKSTKRHVFGYFTEVAWKNSPHWYTGDGDAFLFTLQPVWKRYERTYDQEYCSTCTKSPQLQYLHLPPVTNHLVGNCQDLAGLAVGGVARDAPRLHLTPSLERCMACPMDRQFVSGPLLATTASSDGTTSVDDDDCPIFFDVEELEVYAVRLDSADQADPFERAMAVGQSALDTAEAHRVRTATCDKAQFLDDLVHNAPPGSKLFTHREQCRGRASFAADDEEEKGFYIIGKEPSHRKLGTPQNNDDSNN